MPPNNILLKSLILLIHLKRGYRDTVEKHHTLHVGSYIYRTLLLIHLALVINQSINDSTWLPKSFHWFGQST